MIAIRHAITTDARELAELVAAFPTPTPPDAHAFSHALEAKLSDSRSCLLVAEEDGGRLMGYVAGHCHDTFYAGGQTAWVDEILVVEPARSRGIGKRLMQAFEAWAHARKCVLVSLATRGAAGFYGRLGYESKAAYYKKYLSPP